MYKRFGKKQFVCVELTDYLFRLMYQADSEENSFIVREMALEEGLISRGHLVKEMELFDILKVALEQWGIRNNTVRFFVPDESVLMRPIDLPDDIIPANQRGYVQMELGNSIHLPFEDPLYDIHDFDPTDGKAILFAAPFEDVRRISDLFDDLHLEPEVADIRMLANGRFLNKADLFSSSYSYLVADWTINGLSVGIFTDNELEFLRFQDIETLPNQWKPQEHADNQISFSFSADSVDYTNQLIDQVMEIGRIINFYRFSLHKGERNIEKIILMGDNPQMDFIHTQLKESQEQEILLIDDAFVNRFYPKLSGRHASLIGLAIRGGD